MDIKNLDWNISSQDLQVLLKQEDLSLDYVYGRCSFWGKECFARFLFSEETRHLKRVEISFYKASGPGGEASDFSRTFNILKELLGEPAEYINIDKAGLKELKNIYHELKYESLPRIVWKIEGWQVVHRFKDHWGMIPNTYIEKF